MGQRLEKGDLVEMMGKILTVWDQEDLHFQAEALDMPLSVIRETYLKDVLTKARNILRKGTLQCGDYTISDEVPDSYLDDLLALRWRENLKLCAVQWKKYKEEDT